MTQTIISRYTLCLLLAFMAFSASNALATNGSSNQNTSGDIGGTVSSDDTNPDQTGSEVTGTLSSDADSNQNTSGDIGGTVLPDATADGNLSGTVVDDNSGDGESSGSGGGSRSSSGGTRNITNDSSDTPSGSVLGATSENTVAPGFPNAGFASPTVADSPTLWMTIVAFLKGLTIF